MLVRFYVPSGATYSREVGANAPVVGDCFFVQNAQGGILSQGRVTARRLRTTDGASAPVECECLVDSTVTPW